MKKLFLKSLTIISHVEESANQFLFQNWNLILSDSNNAGKTTLIDMIFWTLGCDVKLKNKWIGCDPQSLLEFEIDGDTHLFVRYKEDFFYRKGTETSYEKYTKITGDFSKKVLESFGLSDLQVFNRDKKLTYPTPTYVLSPFYIEQDLWNEDLFSNVLQSMLLKESYDSILKLYIGYINNDYFKTQLEIEIKKDKVKNLKAELSDINTTSHTINRVLELESENKDYFLKILYEKEGSVVSDIEFKITRLINEKHNILDKINTIQNDKSFYKSQLKIIKSAYIEYEKDYVESVEYQGSEITCPICGVIHDNSIDLRTQLLGDRTEAKQSYIDLSAIIKGLSIELENLKEKLKSIDVKIDNVNSFFSIERDIGKTKISLENLASFSIQNKLKEEENKLGGSIKNESKSLTLLRKSYKESVDEDVINTIDNYFQNRLSTFIHMLGVFDSNYNDISSPMKYNNFSCGKGAENSRSVLALYLSIWSTMEKNDSCFFPIFIDTPNQHEQDATNYPKTIKAIIDNIPNDSQLFVCARDNPELDKLKEKSFIIRLSDPMLYREKYENLKKLFQPL